MKKFRVNEYITLKLENKKTNIYINEELFRQCKFLLLTIPVDKVSTFDDIKSVDEAAEQLNKSMELSKKQNNITPKEEFWAHCSNLQVWAESKYNTCVLHSSLAFPLLEELVEVGDPLAKKIFKEEIAKRLASGVESVVNFLFEEDYIGRYLTKEEFLSAYLMHSELNLLYELEYELGFELYYCYNATDPKSFHIENKKITKINLGYTKLVNFPETLVKFEYLKDLILNYNDKHLIPDSIRKVENIILLKVQYNSYNKQSLFDKMDFEKL